MALGLLRRCFRFLRPLNTMLPSGRVGVDGADGGGLDAMQAHEELVVGVVDGVGEGGGLHGKKHSRTVLACQGGAERR